MTDPSPGDGAAAQDDERLAAAAALRHLGNAFVAHDADAGLLERITGVAEELTASLRKEARRDRAALLAGHVERLFGGERQEVTLHSRFDPMTDRAVGGQTNPISAELEIEHDDDEVVVRTVLGAAYEGAPGRAHGGMVAALFDDVTGFALPLAGTAAYTGELTVRYHRPVPIGTPLEFRTRIAGRQGRKLRITADCTAGDEAVASAEALFIAVDLSRFGTPPA